MISEAEEAHGSDVVGCRGPLSLLVGVGWPRTAQGRPSSAALD